MVAGSPTRLSDPEQEAAPISGTHPCTRIRWAAALLGALLVFAGTRGEAAETALQFNGSSQYVTFGQAPALGLSSFTLEVWFRRDGTGQTASSGSGGVTAVPLLTKGRGEADGSTVDMNWFLGIRASDNVLCADFEEGTGQTSPGLNHPVAGVTPIQNGIWHHAAAAFDGTTWRLCLDGNLEGTVSVGAGRLPQWQSVQHAALASALNSTGAASGYFQGVLDEARVWDHARSQTAIHDSLGLVLTAAPGLVARWGMNEAAGDTAHDSVAATHGSARNGPAWVPGAPLGPPNDPPAAPWLVEPETGATGVTVPAPLRVVVSDPEADDLTVSFYGRPLTTPPPGADFSLILLPDTQYYTAQMNGGSSATFKAQTQWILQNRLSRGIAAVVHLGDIVNDGESIPVEWQRADTALKVLQDPEATELPDGLPCALCVGNHDQQPNGDVNGSTALFNQYFGVANFTGHAYYGGHHGANNDDHFVLFSAGGLDFIVVCIEYAATQPATVLAWADSLLAAHPQRRAIVASHSMLNTGNPATFTGPGQAIYDALKDRPNLILLLGGHNPGEGRRQDGFEGRVVHSLLADYQSRTNGGSGWLRILEFSPAANVVRVRTYSPTLDQWEADADSSSQFTLSVPLSSAPAFALLGTVAGVPSGSTAALDWTGLAPETLHEWYVTLSDGRGTRTGETWSFTTGSPATDVAGVATTGLALAPPAPNPARGTLRISFDLPRAARVRLSVHDLQGRVVTTLADGAFAAGRHALAWDGSIAGGHAGAGLYFVRLETPEGRLVRRVALLR